MTFLELMTAFILACPPGPVFIEHCAPITQCHQHEGKGHAEIVRNDCTVLNIAWESEDQKWEILNLPNVKEFLENN